MVVKDETRRDGGRPRFAVAVHPPLRARQGRARGGARAASSQGNCMPTIALVDDDRNILTSVSIALETEG